MSCMYTFTSEPRKKDASSWTKNTVKVPVAIDFRYVNIEALLAVAVFVSKLLVERTVPVVGENVMMLKPRVSHVFAKFALSVPCDMEKVAVLPSLKPFDTATIVVPVEKKPEAQLVHALAPIDAEYPAEQFTQVDSPLEP